MAIGLGNLLKLARGAVGPDQMGELFEALGVEVDSKAVPRLTQ